MPSTESKLKHCRAAKGMNVAARKLIPVLLFFLSSASIFRFIRITISTNPSPNTSKLALSGYDHDQSSDTMMTEKELSFLSRLVSSRAPCNLLVFGFEPQHIVLASINAGGETIFLEDNPHKISKLRANSNTSSSKVYKIEHQTRAKEAYSLLHRARQNPGCRPDSGLVRESKCELALTKLPREVYEHKWDVILVDGPSGDKPESLGRMEAIYTAGVLARSGGGGGATNVVVHDVDRSIEKWFSWEFLCDENLASSKGRLWNFRISGQENSTTFCSGTTISV